MTLPPHPRRSLRRGPLAALSPRTVLLALALGWLAACGRVDRFVERAREPGPLFAKLPPRERTLVEPVYAMRRSDGDANYFLFNGTANRYTVYANTEPAPVMRGRSWTLAPGERDDPERLKIKGLDPGVRYYFTVVDEAAGVHLIVSERMLPLDGPDNFRDLGGLPTADGRRVKWGHFYRADALDDLSADDLDYVASLDVATVMDFRSEAERSAAPDVLPEGTDYRHVPIYNESEDTTQIRERIRAGTFPVEEAENLLVEVNRLLGSSEADRFQPFADAIAAPEALPLVYHCTSGKDRTGFATLLILSLLGVDEAVVFDDYLMSNYYRYDANGKKLLLANLGSVVEPVDPEVVRPLLLVDPAYLRAAVDTIAAEYGSVAAFAAEVYGITPEVRARMRERYTYSLEMPAAETAAR